MDPLLTFALGSLKALVLLSTAAGLAVALRSRPARLRVVVWSTALAGSLLIPALTPLLPTWSLPVALPLVEVDRDPAIDVAPVAAVSTTSKNDALRPQTAGPTVGPAAVAGRVDPLTVVAAVWALGAMTLLAHLGLSLLQMAAAVKRGRSVTDPRWLKLMRSARARVGCRRDVRLVTSDDVDIPATVGLMRPLIVLPPHADVWPEERRLAVLLHELVHVTRLDWPVWVLARLARAIYWFNPLAWWAARRLDLEQEKACDEEVLALGTRASSYACHLLSVARAAVCRRATAFSGLEMARRSHLEERIMTILNRSAHRRVGLKLLLPAALLVAAMVPALAAVAPGSPEPRPASSELEEIVSEMHAAEARLEPYLESIEALEVEFEPQIEIAERIEERIDFAVLEDIEERMRPHLERIEEIEVDMEPLRERIEALAAEMESTEIHVEDGTPQEIQEQLHEHMETFHAQMEELHREMEPFHELMEEIHREVEPLHEEMALAHLDIEPLHEEMEDVHRQLEPIHEQMESIHREMEPIHEEFERLQLRLEKAIQGEVERALREHLDLYTTSDAPFTEAAARITEDAHVRVNDDEVRIEADPAEVREILNDLLGPKRVGTQDDFDRAVDAAARELERLEIVVG